MFQEIIDAENRAKGRSAEHCKSRVPRSYLWREWWAAKALLTRLLHRVVT